jgi:hypothetical protein
MLRERLSARTISPKDEKTKPIANRVQMFLRVGINETLIQQAVRIGNALAKGEAKIWNIGQTELNIQLLKQDKQHSILYFIRFPSLF